MMCGFFTMRRHPLCKDWRQCIQESRDQAHPSMALLANKMRAAVNAAVSTETR